MKIAIAHNAWHVCGGGELYLGSLAEELAQAHHVALVLTTRIDRPRLRSLLGLSFKNVHFVNAAAALGPQPTRAARLAAEMAVHNVTRAFDLVIRVATGTVPPPCGRNAWLHVQVPFAVGTSGSTKARLRDAWNATATQGYSKVLFNSAFTAGFAAARLRDSDRAVVLTPPVDVTPSSRQQPWHLRPQTILSVGRFDGQGHCKRQRELVHTFARMRRDGLTDWQLVLAGAASARPSSRTYVETLKAESRGMPVQILTNLPRHELLGLYEASRIYWHAAGFGIDEQQHPELVEHFGISTVEAMARGCVPVVIDAGGQREIVSHKVNGYRWQTLAELEDYTWRAIESSDTAAMVEAAARASHAFSRQRFGAQARALADTP